ncbi:DUF2911 domain-containing protein [Granulicella sibirica]|nr:DUF2911 domain-containing protein [Granulicella sibirica]
MNRSTYTTTIISHSSLIDVKIEYSQPLKRGREIFGAVVPYGQLWRVGANGCTTIFTSQDLNFESGILPRGKYALYVVPWPEGWKVMFYTDTSSYGLPRCWDDRALALSVEVPSGGSKSVTEMLSISIEQQSHFEANLEIAWDRTRVSVPFEIPTQRNALEDAAPESGGPSFDDYYMAAKFCYEIGDLQGALLRIDMGLGINKRQPYFYWALKAEIEAKLGNTDAALQYAKTSVDGAKTAGDTYFVARAEGNISRWSQEFDRSMSEEVEA